MMSNFLFLIFFLLENDVELLVSNIKCSLQQHRNTSNMEHICKGSYVHCRDLHDQVLNENEVLNTFAVRC